MEVSDIKRILRLAAAVLGLAALLCGCGIINSSDEETDALYRAIIASIEADDAEALRSLFSEEALEKCTDFEAGFAYTVEAYKGTLVEMKPVSYTEDAHYDKGKHTKEAREAGTYRNAKGTDGTLPPVPFCLLFS